MRKSECGLGNKWYKKAIFYFVWKDDFVTIQENVLIFLEICTKEFRGKISFSLIYFQTQAKNSHDTNIAKCLQSMFYACLWVPLISSLCFSESLKISKFYNKFFTSHNFIIIFLKFEANQQL